jgi:hypothetical protein
MKKLMMGYALIFKCISLFLEALTHPTARRLYKLKQKIKWRFNHKKSKITFFYQPEKPWAILVATMI